ncbi:hypothetical protein [Sphingobacterium corticibacter]|uniref:Chromosome partitioning protein ParA n=1 Tax=Sphingobacterium corticibacter TaxID=2171749 RepID=A0A2T8HHP5_9SPHI|nr:hypothetical protein [Sphingobacterium corticibacter]PVH24923.1 hypothetical protein DC487_12485 [Sphingobacterium corticibacter]
MNVDRVELEREEEKKAPQSGVNRNVYFFILAIAALIVTNVYFYIKFKSSGEKLYTVTLQRENLQTDIDRIEAELDNASNQGVEYTDDLEASESEARMVINNLRQDLSKNDISETELVNVRNEVAGLKDRVSQFRDEVVGLRVKTELLARENSLLQDELDASERQIANLKDRQSAMTTKMSKASSIKVSNVSLNGISVKRDGTHTTNVRAKRIDQMQISFTIADNPIAEIGKKEIYVRIINPSGNLIANSEDLFYVHGEKLQYTFKENISFTNNGEEYQLFWSDENAGFKKGAYTVLLYADNAIMGRASVVFK